MLTPDPHDTRHDFVKSCTDCTLPMLTPDPHDTPTSVQEDEDSSANSTDATAQNSTVSVLAYSNATTVPAVVSVATLSSYATVAAFNTSERERVCFLKLCFCS